MPSRDRAGPHRKPARGRDRAGSRHPCPDAVRRASRRRDRRRARRGAAGVGGVGACAERCIRAGGAERDRRHDVDRRRPVVARAAHHRAGGSDRIRPRKPRRRAARDAGGARTFHGAGDHGRRPRRVLPAAGRDRPGAARRLRPGRRAADRARRARGVLHHDDPAAGGRAGGAVDLVRPGAQLRSRTRGAAALRARPGRRPLPRRGAPDRSARRLPGRHGGRIHRSRRRNGCADPPRLP